MTISRSPNLIGKKTRSVSLDAGMKLLEGFLNGFGVTPPDLSVGFTATKEVAFSFDNVVSYYVEAAALGKLLEGRQVDAANPVLAEFFQKDGCPLFVIDATVTSNAFTISIDRAHDANAKIDVGAIKKLVGDLSAAVDVKSTSEMALTFSGRQQLAFAFTARRFHLDGQGHIRTLSPDWSEAWKDVQAREQDFRLTYSPDLVGLADAPTAMLAWDDDLVSRVDQGTRGSGGTPSRDGGSEGPDSDDDF